MGNQTIHTLADGQANTFTYNVMNRLTREDYFDGTVYQYSHTNGGQLHQVRDGSGQVLTTYGYDALNRPNQVTHQDGQYVNYTYDPVGNRTAISAPNYAVNYLYDALNQVVGVTDSDGTTSLSYDPVGLLTTIARPNGITTTYAYDNRYFLTGIQHRDSVDDLIAGYAYTYDDVGNRLSQSLSNGVQTTWAYDDAYRLLSETTTGGSFAGQTNYTYDAVGNRLTQTANGATTNYTYNALDQLISDGTSTYSYDARGNLTTVSSGLSATSYAWNAQDRLASVTTPVDTVVYEYDYAGRRVGEAVNGDTTNYLWDEFSRYGNILFEYDSNGTNTAYTLLGNTVLSQRQNGLTNYNLTDALGSVRVVSDDAGQVVETLDYSAFGEPLFTESISTHLFAGEHYDEITGLYYLRARSYSPELGRFLSRDAWPVNYGDPVELNRYVYGINNPTNYTDPSGYSALSLLAQLFKIVADANNYRPIGAATGAMWGAFGSGLSSIGWYSAAKSGVCGPELKYWANNTDFGSFFKASIAIGTGLGAALGAGGPEAQIAGVTLGYIMSASQLSDNLCSVVQFALSGVMLVKAVSSINIMPPPSGGMPPMSGGLAVMQWARDASLRVSLQLGYAGQAGLVITSTGVVATEISAMFASNDGQGSSGGDGPGEWRPVNEGMSDRARNY